MFWIFEKLFGWLIPDDPEDEDQKAAKEAKRLPVPEAQRSLRVHPKRKCKFWDY